MVISTERKTQTACMTRHCNCTTNSSLFLISNISKLIPFLSLTSSTVGICHMQWLKCAKTQINSIQTNDLVWKNWISNYLIPNGIQKAESQYAYFKWKPKICRMIQFTHISMKQASIIIKLHLDTASNNCCRFWTIIVTKASTDTLYKSIWNSAYCWHLLHTIF